MSDTQWNATGVFSYPEGRREYKIWDGLHEVAAVPIVQGSDGTRERAIVDLIVLAPELIETLVNVLRYLVTPSGLPDVGKGRTLQQQNTLDRARAVLAKAPAPDSR